MRALAFILAFLTGCAAGPHPLPPSAVEHLESAKNLPDTLVTVGCTPELPCNFKDGVWYPQAIAAHMAGAERCCADSVAELKKVDRPGVDALTIALTAIGAGIAAGITVAAGYEIRDLLKR